MKKINIFDDYFFMMIKVEQYFFLIFFVIEINSQFHYLNNYFVRNF